MTKHIVDVGVGRFTLVCLPRGNEGRSGEDDYMFKLQASFPGSSPVLIRTDVTLSSSFNCSCDPASNWLSGLAFVSVALLHTWRPAADMPT